MEWSFGGIHEACQIKSPSVKNIVRLYSRHQDNQWMYFSKIYKKKNILKGLFRNSINDPFKNSGFNSWITSKDNALWLKICMEAPFAEFLE